MVSALCERIRVSQLRWLASPPGTGHQHRHGQRQRASARASVEGRQPCGRKVNPAPIAPRRTLHAAHRVRSQAAQPGQRHDASQRCQRPKAAVEPAPPPARGWHASFALSRGWCSSGAGLALKFCAAGIGYHHHDGNAFVENSHHYEGVGARTCISPRGDPRHIQLPDLSHDDASTAPTRMRSSVRISIKWGPARKSFCCGVLPKTPTGLAPARVVPPEGRWNRRTSDTGSDDRGSSLGPSRFRPDTGALCIRCDVATWTPLSIDGA